MDKNDLINKFKSKIKHLQHAALNLLLFASDSNDANLLNLNFDVLFNNYLLNFNFRLDIIDLMQNDGLCNYDLMS